MEFFVALVNDWKSLNFITKSSILDVAMVIDVFDSQTIIDNSISRETTKNRLGI